MDEEEELDITLIGQEEAPAIDTGDALIGKPSFLPYADDVAPSRVNALSVFTPGGDLKPGIDVNAIAPAPTTLPAPSDVSTALNQEVPVGSPDNNDPSFMSRLGSFFNPSGMGGAGGLPPTFTPPSEGATLAEGRDPLITPVTLESLGLESSGQRIFKEALERGETPSNINPFTGETTEKPTPLDSDVSSSSGMTIDQSAIMNALSNQNQGMDMNQQAVSNAQIQGATQGQETTQGQAATTPSLDQTLSQFMRNEDAPEQRTEQFVDPQGRLRRRLTPEASALQGFAPGVQPLAPEYTGFEEASADLQERLRANQRQPGESQADRDTRVAQSRTTGGQTEGLSFDDARRRAEGQLAARGVRNPSASQVNALARGIQAAEPERLAELETKRAINEARLKTAQATLDRPEFEGKVYTVNGVTFAQTSRGGAQVIDTGSETPEQSTAQIQNFEFTLDQIDKAREAYSAGDVDRANDILTAAGIQKNGIDVTANEYFGDLDPQVTPPVPTTQATDTGFTQQQEANIQKVLAANPNSTRADVVEAMEKAGKL